MPVYDFKCQVCDKREEHILLSGESAPESCVACGGALKRTYGGSRVHISLVGWGFAKNDSLISDTRGKDFKAIRERAARMVDE